MSSEPHLANVLDVQDMMDALSSDPNYDVDPYGAFDHIIIRFAQNCPFRIRSRALDRVSARIGPPETIVFGKDAIVAWSVSDRQYASIGCELADMVSENGIVDIRWCGNGDRVRGCDDCINESPISGCCHPQGYVYQYDDVKKPCPYHEGGHL